MRPKFEPIHSKLSFSLGAMALAILTYLGFRHLNDIDEYGQSWGKFALFQAALCLVGLIGTLLIVENKILPDKFRSISIDTGIRALIILTCSMISQYIVKTQLSVSTTEKALYYLFAGIGEEMFFRLFLIETIKKISGNTPSSKALGIIFSSLAFTAIHVNYYNNFPQLMAVFVGGLILSIFYVVWSDITANMLAHFLLNLIAVGNVLVTFTANLNLLFAISLFAIALIFYKLKDRHLSHKYICGMLLIFSTALIIESIFSAITILPPSP